jgi:hypothetical protein
MKKIFFISIIATSLSVHGQDTLTLICQGSKNPDFQKYVYVDMKNNKVIHQDSFENYVTDDLITYSFMLDGNKHQTKIYRATGKYTVFVSGAYNYNFSFGGYCQKKTANKF